MKATQIKKILTVDIKAEILKFLQELQYPIDEKSLLSKFSIDAEKLRYIFRDLENEGYDIKTMWKGRSKRYILVRFADVDRKDYYRVQGELQTPLLLTSCWHLGSKSFSQQAYNMLLKDIDKYKIKSVVHLGDLLQGRGVHRLELQDLKEPEIEKQIDMGISYLSKVPVEVKLMLGNHEEKLKGSVDVGLDALRQVAMGCDNVLYCGAVGKFILDKKYTLLAMHSKGGNVYARSYPVQKIWRELVERPDILAIGHNHVPLVMPAAGNHMLVMVPALQRETAYLIWRGIIAEIGWVIINRFDGHDDEVIIRRPTIY